MNLTPRRSAPWALLALLSALTAILFGGAPVSSHAQADSPAPTPAPQGSEFYGINFIQPRQPWLAIGFNSGARVVRWQFNWRDAEPDPGNWTWNTTDHQVSAWNLAGLKIHAILHYPPDYAIATPGTLVPTNLGASWGDDVSSFSRFCNKFAERYRGRIASYEIWNEPDLPVFWGGTADQYYTLLKGCYQGIKAADPGITVAMAGMAYTENKQFFNELIQIAARDPDGPANHNFFDVMAIHMYANPEIIYQYTMDARSIMDAHGIVGKPIWITETNVPLWGRNGAPSVPIRGFASLEEASWYVLQAASNAIAAGAGKLMFFRLADDNMAGEAWGLVEANASPRPAYRALQVASGVLQNITQAQRTVINDDVVVTDMRRQDGARIVTAYSRAGRSASVTVKAETSAAVLINAKGGYTPIEADSDGNYTFNVPTAPGRNLGTPHTYTVGGPVVILIESDRDPPSATVETVAVPFDKLHVLVRWKGDDGHYGTGVDKYTVEFSDNGADWEPWQTDTSATEAVFDISKGGTFGFRVKAVDKVGNVGSFSSPAAVTLNLVGTLSGHIVDLRGQSVPSARVKLSDGSLHDADANGWVHIELPPGMAQVTHIDGGVQGESGAQPQVMIELAEETAASWLVAPKGLIRNGDFTSGLGGWQISSPADARQVTSNEALPQPVLRLNGRRRAWGPPAAWVTVKVPPEYTTGVVSFSYRLLGLGYTLRLRAVTAEEQMLLWQTDTLMNQRTRVWLDVSQLAGREVTLRFELWGPKDLEEGAGEIDDVVLGNVPIQTPTPAN